MEGGIALLLFPHKRNLKTIMINLFVITMAWHGINKQGSSLRHYLIRASSHLHGYGFILRGDGKLKDTLNITVKQQASLLIRADEYDN